jgi:anti-sigma B factor antagonist
MSQFESQNKVSILNVPYESIDLQALEQLKSQADQLFARKNYNIIMDMSKINYLSSTGLGLLVYINNKCNESGGNFAVCGLQEYTLDMLKLTKLDNVINIFNTLKDAEHAFSSTGM